MSGFTKLFSTIVTSSIWSEDDKTRIVWITMLALANREGIVEAAVPGLANAARVSVEDCEAALRRFSEPDKYSRSKAHDGRRIETIDGGWKLLNHSSYREKLSGIDRGEYQRIKQASYRKRKKNKREMPGESEYDCANRNGASKEELDEIVTRHLPEGLREQSVPYQA